MPTLTMKTSKNKTITINSSLAHISLALINRKHFKAGFQNLLKILEASIPLVTDVKEVIMIIIHYILVKAL